MSNITMDVNVFSVGENNYHYLGQLIFVVCVQLVPLPVEEYWIVPTKEIHLIRFLEIVLLESER